jgi:hypothetical protein
MACRKADATSPAVQPSTAPSGTVWAVSDAGVGPVKIGMTDIELRTATVDRVEKPDLEAGCSMVRLLDAPGDVAAMIADQHVVRIDVLTAGVRTASNIGIGDSEAQVRAAYEKVAVQPHKYTDGHYLSVQRPNKLRLVFETDGKVVTRYRLGALPQVDWVEGCS